MNRLGRGTATLAALAMLWTAALAQDALRLSLKQAVALALSEQGNAQVQISGETVQQAKAASARARSFLLPHLEANVSEQDQTRNLEAIGLRPQGLFQPPTLVGPFTTFDARASLAQTVLDLPAIRRFQASRAGGEAASATDEGLRDSVAAQVAGLYLNALRTQAALEAAQADVQLGEELLGLAARQKEAGFGTRVDETRARVQLANHQQRLFASRLESGRALLELKRAVGLDLSAPVELTDTLQQGQPSAQSFEEAWNRALISRSDLQARQRSLRSAELLYSAARLQRVPSVAGFASYGSIGSAPNDMIPTWAAGLTLRLPIFDGGRMEADRAETSSKLRQERIQTEDLRRQIELEVRVALSGVELTRRQVEVAGEGLQLAQDELAQARRRYEAGFTASVEVTDAQSRLERARQNRIAALYSYGSALLNLSQAMGTVRQDLQ